MYNFYITTLFHKILSTLLYRNKTDIKEKNKNKTSTNLTDDDLSEIENSIPLKDLNTKPNSRRTVRFCINK